MDHAIYISQATAARVATHLNAQRAMQATVRPATSRSQLLGYHVSLNGVNITENEAHGAMCKGAFQ
jgi:hypothetical protein